MPLKWNDTTERMVLLKALEQHPSIKIDGDAAVDAWPIELGKVTKRSIEDRFNLLKRQLRDAAVPPTNGLTSTLSPAVFPTPTVQQPAPATPAALPNKRIKKKSAGSRLKQTVASPNPISTASGSSKPAFTNRLLDKSRATTQPQNKSRSRGSLTKQNTYTQARGKTTKRKRDEDEDSEPSMPSEDSASSKDESDDQPLNESPSTGRRSLPRRSKSVSVPPGKYQEDSSSSISSEHSTENDQSEDSDARPPKKVKGKAISKKRKQITTASDEDPSDDDSTYDIRHEQRKSHHAREDTDSDTANASKKPKPKWRERIDRVQREMNEERNDGDASDDSGEGKGEVDENDGSDDETVGEEDSDMGTQA